jgi:hypothetical protein
MSVKVTATSVAEPEGLPRIVRARLLDDEGAVVLAVILPRQALAPVAGHDVKQLPISGAMAGGGSSA